MNSYLFELRHNGQKYTTVSGTSKDVQEVLNEDKAVYSGKLTKKVVGLWVNVDGQARLIKFNNVKLSSKDEIEMPNRMLQNLIRGNFSDTNQSFFMVERSLINEERTELTTKGKEIVEAWKM